jgi:hypothetical protein
MRATWLVSGGRRLVLLIGLVFLSPLFPTKADARSDTGTAVGVGLGAFALGSALGAASNPYYRAYYYPPAPAYYPPPVYYPAPTPVYYPSARSCWDPYNARYYAC